MDSALRKIGFYFDTFIFENGTIDMGHWKVRYIRYMGHWKVRYVRYLGHWSYLPCSYRMTTVNRR